ncbi:hypothetical protein [Pinirhizobacter sp.]|uniref:hypothetical protein n=1 Tax=Pinirhizobacter sp. TaxID=2950432 RepID=UPI002F3F8509
MKIPDQPLMATESDPRLLRQQRAFMARAVASREETKRTGIYFDAREVHDELRAKLASRIREETA